MNELRFINFAKIILATVFFVILAGGIVRTTQSGMGCPDWPRCFGRWVPPTNESQLPANYKKIYAFKYVDTSFNVYHTWVEYLNRLAGMILGILLLIQFIWIMRYWKTKKIVATLCGVNLFLTGFQGYLGSKVVEANLEVVKITIHMLVALLIAALSLLIINKMSAQTKKVADNKLRFITSLTIILLLAQVILGTQVRQQIDNISKSLDFMHRDQWISKLNYIFYMHRSFSLVIAVLCMYLFLKYRKLGTLNVSTNLILFTVMGNILLGMTMAYLDVPVISQPLHLIFSSVLLMAVFFNWLNTERENFQNAG